MPPVVLATLSDAGIKDLRHLYRAAVCAQLPPDSLPCEELILRFPGEAKADGPSTQRDVVNRYQIAFVPGLFSDCLNGTFYPFTDVSENVKASGSTVHDFPTAGRAGSAENARRLAKRLAELSPDLRPIIMIVYSKGLADVLELLLRYPEISQHLAAIISIAGASNGARSRMTSMSFIEIGLRGSRYRGVARGQARKFKTYGEMSA